jgi:mRNA-degrading endonuclease RelE of RelBE toxin-antitoxin system
VRRTLLWHHDAVEDLFEIHRNDPRVVRRILIELRSFGKGQTVDLKKLVDRNDQWRIRVGAWRVVLTLSGDRAEVDGVDNRRDAYR